MNRALALTLASATLVACKPEPAPQTPDATAVPESATSEGPAPEPTPSDEGANVDTAEGGAAADDGGTAPLGTPEAGKKYDLVVSFTSPGDGTDRAAADKLTALVAETKNLQQVSGRWGREGEHDECFTLTALSPAERTAFIARVKKEVGTSKKVNISEAAECQHNAR